MLQHSDTHLWTLCMADAEIWRLSYYM